MPPAALARGTTRVSAAAVCRKSVATVTCPVTWTVASSTPAVSLQTAWRFAWSAAAFASPPEGPGHHHQSRCLLHTPTILGATSTSVLLGLRSATPLSLLLGLYGLHYIGWRSWLHYMSIVSYKACQEKDAESSHWWILFPPLLIQRWDSSFPALSVHCYTAGCMVQSEFQLWSTSVCQAVQIGPLDPHSTSYYYNGAPCAV